MPRPHKCRKICALPKVMSFGPLEHPLAKGETVQLGVDEYEVIRLVDLLGMTQEQCAKRMNIARTTVTRIYEAARKKIADSLVNGKKLSISGGEIAVCDGQRPECADNENCCWRRDEEEGLHNSAE
jgi:predicted DNA-binding protein (UPF0251 family)